MFQDHHERSEIDHRIYLPPRGEASATTASHASWDMLTRGRAPRQSRENLRIQRPLTGRSGRPMARAEAADQVFRTDPGGLGAALARPRARQRSKRQFGE
jgi:hypothetical protein